MLKPILLSYISRNEELNNGISKDYLCVWSSQSLNTTVESKSTFRGEVMSISLVEDLNYHEKESAPPETKDFINKHGSYFLTIPSIPCSYKKSPKMIYNSSITCKTCNPFLLSVYTNFKRVIVDTFVYHKFCKF